MALLIIDPKGVLLMKRYYVLAIVLMSVVLMAVVGCGSNATGGGSSGGGGAVAFKADIYVSTTGSDSTGNGTLAHPYQTIQKAMNMARANKVIGVLAGVYTEEVTWTSSIDVKLLGINRETVTLEAPSGDQCIRINNGLPVSQVITVESMTISKMNLSTIGGAINMETDSIVVHIKNMKFDGNTSGGNGAALYFSSISSLLIVDSCEFKNNETTGGAGSAIYSHGRTLINNCMFKDNVTLDNGTVAFSEFAPYAYMCSSTFEGNSSGGYAGAIANTGTVLTIEACTFKYNSASNGGAVYVSTASGKKTLIKNCTFDYNRATSVGGAMWIAYPIKIESCTFSNNTAEVMAGAIGFASTSTIATIENTVFYRNKAITNGGGAILHTGVALGGVETHIVNCTFVSNEANSATYGSAVYMQNTGVKIMNSIFNNNIAPPTIINTVSHNLLYSAYDFTPSGAIEQSNTNEAVAFEVFPTDLRLSSTCSVNIYEGGTFEALGIVAPTVDRDGVARSLHNSMGAYQRN
jgi:predicted outer membrane repeat protein